MDDLISRQAAMNDLWKALYEYEDKQEKLFIERDDLDVGDWVEHRIFVQNMNDIDRKVIMNLPTAEPRKGKWIYDDEAYPGGSPYGHYECDQCGEYVPHKTNFCPNCGVKMETAAGVLNSSIGSC